MVLENVSPDGKELPGSSGRLINPGTYRYIPPPPPPISVSRNLEDLGHPRLMCTFSSRHRCFLVPTAENPETTGQSVEDLGHRLLGCIGRLHHRGCLVPAAENPEATGQILAIDF